MTAPQPTPAAEGGVTSAEVRRPYHLSDADLDGLVALLADARRGGCFAHEACRAQVDKPTQPHVGAK